MIFNERNVWRVVTLSVVVAMLSSLIIFSTLFVFADPSGATFTFNSSENGPTASPTGHAANRSTFTTVILNSVQQDQHWKAYVGNITGLLTLDDADGNTIYNWSTTDISGEVYATRDASADFGTVACANSSIIATENTFHNMSQGQVDTINATFAATAHQAFIVAGQSFSADNCSSTALYVNDGYVAPGSGADFQEILLQDTDGSLLFMSIINDDTNGFDNNPYDFQMIVAESDVKSTPTTYYFYVELDS